MNDGVAATAADDVPRTVRIAYHRVWDASYPRNRRIREYLESLPGVSVTVFPSSRSRFKAVRVVSDVVRPFVTLRNYDVCFVAEYAINYAPAICLAGRLHRARVVVDGFVGKYETVIGDWRRHGPRSPIARAYALIDRLSVTWSDLYLTDTEVRAEAVRRRVGRRGRVLSLPVGAPSWARVLPRPEHRRDDRFRVLFYGLYVPLHGVETILRAMASVRDPSITVTLVGDGALRSQMEGLADELGLAARCEFLPPVPEHELARIIAGHDVVLGVFGDSEQAGTVIPNKVWQGLACGRRVVTRESPALAEIAGLVGDDLITVPPSDPAALAAALDRCASGPAGRDDIDSASRLGDYVRGRFGELGDFVATSRR
jgi:glycosyltransferase involved in cell wall biosynthesis